MYGAAVGFADDGDPVATLPFAGEEWFVAGAGRAEDRGRGGGEWAVVLPQTGAKLRPPLEEQYPAVYVDIAESVG